MKNSENVAGIATWLISKRVSSRSLSLLLCALRIVQGCGYMYREREPRARDIEPPSQAFYVCAPNEIDARNSRGIASARDVYICFRTEYGVVVFETINLGCWVFLIFIS